MIATIESTHENGSPKTFRDEHANLWRIAVDAGDGTLAVESICDGEEAVEDRPLADETPCGILTWFSDGATICVAIHGENSTDPSEYTGANGERWLATQDGWECDE